MNKRPLAVTLLGSLLAAAGVIGLAYHSSDLNFRGPFPYDVLLISLVRALAIVAGVYMILGHNWARRLALLWISFHVVVSFYHSLGEVVIHGLLLAVFAYFLFRPDVAQYFRGRKPSVR